MNKGTASLVILECEIASDPKLSVEQDGYETASFWVKFFDYKGVAQVCPAKVKGPKAALFSRAERGLKILLDGKLRSLESMPSLKCIEAWDVSIFPTPTHLEPPQPPPAAA